MDAAQAETTAGASASGIIRWEVEEVSKLASTTVRSPIVEVDGMKWNLGAKKEGGELAIFLALVEKNESLLWSFDVAAEMVIFNRTHENMAIEFQEKFSFDRTNWGFKFLAWETVMDEEKGFIKDDKLSIEARFSLHNYKGIRKAPLIDFTDSTDSRHDVTLIVEGKKLHVNKSFLSIHSPVFNTMFYGDFCEKDKNEIEINETCYEEFVMLLNMIYPSDQKITDENVEFLLMLGDRFEIKTVVDQAESFLVSSSKHTIPVKLKLSDRFRLHILQDHCLKTFTSVEEVTALKKTNEYKDLSHVAKSALLERIIKLTSGEWEC